MPRSTLIRFDTEAFNQTENPKSTIYCNYFSLLCFLIQRILGVRKPIRRFRNDAELAAKISNDIAEDIDCGESRDQLRMAVAYWADVACVESQRRAEAESTVAIFKTAKALMDVVLPPNDPSPD